MSTDAPPVSRSVAAAPSAAASTASVRARRHARRLVWVLAVYALLCGVAVLMIAPFVAMVSVSLQTGARAARFPIEWIPSVPTLVNYRAILEHSQIGRWFVNSIVVASVGTALAVATASTAGYAFARLEFPLRSALFWSFLAMLMVPSQVTLIPEYLLLAELNWINTYAALILPGVTSAFGIFLIRQYLQAIPRDFEDAARLDGASEFRVYLDVVLPMLTPAIATLGTLQFLNYWNEFLYPLVVTTSADMRTLPVGLATLQTPTGGLPELLAGTTIAVVPTMVVFLFFQRYFVRGIVMSGLKG
jgi:multiple sugar transport system permease protein